MSKTQIVNTLVNTWGLDRAWLNQFQVKDLEEMLHDFKTKKLVAC